MNEATQHYLNSQRAIAFPNGQAFVERKDIPLAKRLIDLGLAKIESSMLTAAETAGFG